MIHLETFNRIFLTVKLDRNRILGSGFLPRISESKPIIGHFDLQNTKEIIKMFYLNQFLFSCLFSIDDLLSENSVIVTNSVAVSRNPGDKGNY